MVEYKFCESPKSWSTPSLVRGGTVWVCGGFGPTGGNLKGEADDLWVSNLASQFWFGDLSSLFHRDLSELTDCHCGLVGILVFLCNQRENDCTFRRQYKFCDCISGTWYS